MPVSQLVPDVYDSHSLETNHVFTLGLAFGVTISMVSLVVLLITCTDRKRDTPRPRDFERSTSIPGNVTFQTKQEKVLVIGTQDGSNTIYDDAPTSTDADWTTKIEQSTVGGNKQEPQQRRSASEPPNADKIKKKKKNLKPSRSDNTEELVGFGDIDTTFKKQTAKIDSESQYDGFDDEALPSLPPSPQPVLPQPSEGKEVFSGFDNIAEASDGYSTLPTESKDTTSDEKLSPRPASIVEPAQMEVDEDDETIPAWYAGKLSRDLCVEAVLASANGDFLIRESSHGDRCVICINDRGSAINLVINVTADRTYRFAGKERESLHDVLFFLRKKPLYAKDGTPVLLGKPAPQATAQEKQQQLDTKNKNASAARAERERKLQFMQRKQGLGRQYSTNDERTDMIISLDGNELYTEASMVDGAVGLGTTSYPGETEQVEEEPLYVDMSDANVPSYDYIAEREEEERAAQAGRIRVSNEEFGKIKAKARERAATAAAMNREKVLANLKQKSVRKHWKQLAPNASAVVPDLPPIPSKSKSEEENFFEYENASAREFGGYEEEDIYGETVPRWFAPRLARAKCEKIVDAGANGTYLVRESSTGDKYIICVKHNDGIINFQIHVRGAGQFEFSGRKYSNLEDVIAFSQKNGILKNKTKITLLHIPEW